MQNLNLYLWVLTLSFITVTLLVNYLFIKLGLPSKGLKKYGVIKDVINPRIIIIDSKKLMFWKKTYTIQVRYISENITDKDLKKIKNYLIGKNVRFIKIYNIFDIIDFKDPKSIIKSMFVLGDTYNVEILDDDLKNLKYMPKSLKPSKDYIKTLINDFNCEFVESDIMGIFDRKIYSNLLNKNRKIKG